MLIRRSIFKLRFKYFIEPVQRRTEAIETRPITTNLASIVMMKTMRMRIMMTKIQKILKKCFRKDLLLGVKAYGKQLPLLK